MGFWTQEVKRSELAAGDHIYTWRTAFIYAHHGIYVGENLVVHFINPNWNSSVKTCSKSNPGCKTGKDNNGVAIYCLDCFLEKGSLYRYEYGGGRWFANIKIRGGTSTSKKSDPEDIVINRAKHLLHTGFGDYNLILNNCEDFALYCKTGQRLPASSGQVTQLSFVMPPSWQFFKMLGEYAFSK